MSIIYSCNWTWYETIKVAKLLMKMRKLWHKLWLTLRVQVIWLNLSVLLIFNWKSIWYCRKLKRLFMTTTILHYNNFLSLVISEICVTRKSSTLAGVSCVGCRCRQCQFNNGEGRFKFQFNLSRVESTQLSSSHKNGDCRTPLESWYKFQRRSGPNRSCATAFGGWTRTGSPRERVR